MFDPRDFAADPRTRPEARPRRDHAKERENRERDGHRREYDPRGTKRQTFQDRTDRAIADVGMYRNVAYRDLADAHFEGHPYAARRAVDQMVRAGHVREHNAEGPQGGSYKVLTLTERGVERAERVARDQGLDSQQKAWSGLVKPGELQHDVAVFRAARIEQMKLLEQGTVLKRIRIDAELKREIARATETSRARGGKAAADAARLEAAAAHEIKVLSNSKQEIPAMQPWKISVGFTVIILAVATMVGGEHFAYLQPHLQIILTDYWMSVAWYGGLAIVTLLAVIYAAARALGLADMGLKVDLMERSIRRGGGGQTELAKKLGQEDRGQFPGA